MSSYHANDEYCTISGMEIGFKVMVELIADIG